MESFLAYVDYVFFVSLDHKVLISVLKKIRFGQNFISWIEIFLKNQELRVIKGGKPQSILNLTE